MAATLKQIAAMTGLSIPTVHQILNNYDAPFAAATRRKVLAAAAEVDYRPNIAARSLVTQRSFLVGVLFYGVNYSITTRFMSGVQAGVMAHGCSPIFLTHATPAEEAANLQSALERRVDGLIVNVAIDPDGATNVDRLAAVHAKGLPMVEVFGRFVPGVPKVTLDYRATATAATERLIADGHRRIALVIREEYGADQAGGRLWTATEFGDGYQSAMRAAGLPPRVQRYSVGADDTRENAVFSGAAKAVPALFANPAAAPTAAVCYSAEAGEATARCYDRRRRPTRPLTVAAFGDLRPALSDRVHLLCMPMPAERAGRSAADALFAQVAGRSVPDVALGPDIPTAELPVGRMSARTGR